MRTIERNGDSKLEQTLLIPTGRVTVIKTDIVIIGVVLYCPISQEVRGIRQ